MSDMLTYLKWRGDILFSEMGPNPVDALIFSILAYIRFEGIVPEDALQFLPLREAAKRVMETDDPQERCRTPNDLTLLTAAAETERFGRIGISRYKTVFIPEEETQFAAVTFYLEDGSAFLTFRGTDNTLVGWKEDFNMTFEDSVPAQRLAAEYVKDFSIASLASIRLGGHSKGGNLAVYAAAKSIPQVQRRILAVYNHDGPGFREEMMTEPGYQQILPKVKTYVPQSSVFGMLLEHEGPFTIVKSRQIGLMQHDPHTWEVMGGNFILMEERTGNSRFLDRTFKNWLAGMTRQERGDFFDTVFELLMTDSESPRDLIKPQNVKAILKALGTDEQARRIIARELIGLMESARTAQQEMEQDTLPG